MHLLNKSFSGGSIDITVDAFVVVKGKWRGAVVRRNIWWAVVWRI
jgi:hypothetical protein